MNKILAKIIFGMAITGSILIISVPFLFKYPRGIALQISIASALIFVLLTIFALTFKKRFENDLK